MTTYVAGQKIFEWTVIQNLPYNKNKSPNLRRSLRLECICGTRVSLPNYYLEREKPKKHCGCLNRGIRTINYQEYRIWTMMRKRCNDPTHISYKHYGGRGIKVYPEWDTLEDGFEKWFAVVGKRPSPNHSLDRINNNLGYQPFQEDGITPQLKWSTATEQRANQRPK